MITNTVTTGLLPIPPRCTISRKRQKPVTSFRFIGLQRCFSQKANAKTLGKQLKEERPGAETAADVVAEVARQRMLALAAAQRTEDVRLPTPVALKRGHSLGKGPAFGPSED